MPGLETTPESVEYAIFVLDPPPGISKAALRCRLYAFGELIELLVLADTLFVEESLSKAAPAFLGNTGFHNAVRFFQGPDRPEQEWSGSWRVATELLRHAEGLESIRASLTTDTELNRLLDTWLNTTITLLAHDSSAFWDFIEFLLPYMADDDTAAEQFRMTYGSASRGSAPITITAADAIRLGFVLRGVVESALVVNDAVPAALVPIGIERRLLSQMPVFSTLTVAVLNKLADARERDLVQALNSLHGRYSRVTVWPVLFSAIVSEATSLTELYDAALNWRESAPVKRYRQWCNELDNAMISGHESQIIRLSAASEEFVTAITKRVDRHSALSTIQLQVSFPPSITFSPGGLFTPARHRKLLLLKRITDGILAPPALSANLASIFGISLLD